MPSSIRLMRADRAGSSLQAEGSRPSSSRATRNLKLSAQFVDSCVAAVLSFGAVASVLATHDERLAPIALVCALVGSGSVAWRRRFPLGAATASIVALLILNVIQSTYQDNQLIFEPIAMGLNFYMVGRSPRSSRRAWEQFVVLIFGITASAIGAWHEGGQSVVDLASGLLIFIGLPFVAGAVISRRKAMTTSLSLATTSLEIEVARRADLAAQEERTWIARELHDAIAHEVSVMVIQTSVARRRLSHDRRQSEEALRSVIASGHRALEELRHITGVVRRVDAYSGPAPGLDRLAELLRVMRSTGLQVDLAIEGPSVSLPQGLDLVAYRIIQEALMNTLKHAGALESSVTLRFLDRALELEVADTGRGTKPPYQVGDSGLGLIGMRERVLLFGGALDAGTNERGGFTVKAWLPLSGVPT